MLSTLVLSCAAHVGPAPRHAASSAPDTAPPPAAPAAEVAPPASGAPGHPTPSAAPTVIDFEEDTGGALPDGPELEVVQAKARARFRSLIDKKYLRGDGGSPTQETVGSPDAE